MRGGFGTTRLAMDRDLMYALSGTVYDLLAFFEENKDGAVRFLAQRARTRKLKHLHRMVGVTPLLVHFLRPRSNIEIDVFESLAKISPAHHAFFNCWVRLRFDVDRGRIFPDHPSGVHRKQVGPVAVYLKVLRLTRPHHGVAMKNEAHFARVSTALSLANLSCGLPPFAVVTTDGVHMRALSVDGGQTMLKSKVPLWELVAQVPMALWALRAYGGLYHYDLHSSNVVAKPCKKRCLVWSCAFESGLTPPHEQSPHEMLQGICLPESTFQVTVIDGGLAEAVTRNRAEVIDTFCEGPYRCGWDDLDLDTDDEALGAALFNAATREAADGTREYIAAVLIEDVPDPAVDLVSFLTCLILRGYSAPLVHGLLGALVRVVRADPAFGYEAFITFMLNVAEAFRPVTVVTRPREPDDYVVPLPEPGETVDALVAEFVREIYGV